jgi:hypothetical protein
MPPHRSRQFMKHGTVPQMAVFEATVRLGSFTGAAQELHMAQPTVSGLVRKLSDSAGVPLFEKVGRHVVPTAAGRMLYASADAILKTLERAAFELAALRTCAGAENSGDDRVFTSRRRISLGFGASSEPRKNGIPNRCVPGTPQRAVASRCGLSAGVHASTEDAPRWQAHRKPESPHMDDTIDYSIVFAKTPKGVAEINARSGALTLQARRVLIMIDGHRPVAELMAVVRSGEFDGIMSTLESQGMIEKVDLSAVPPRDYEEEDFADTISLLQENAAALRSVPHIHPAALAPQPVQPRPASIGAIQGMEVVADAAAIAARAVATASGPRPVEPVVRRPPTISMPAPVATNDMAVGTARPGTLNGTMRVPEPVRRPPTLTGARPAPVTAPVQEHATAAVEAPARPAPATVRTEAAQAPASAAPAPAVNVPTRSFDEEKRTAIKELYSVLGPYGEQPVAKLQECTTIETLREQIKQAGRRIATFRGEKAAQDYLRTFGQA